MSNLRRRLEAAAELKIVRTAYELRAMQEPVHAERLAVTIRALDTALDAVAALPAGSAPATDEVCKLCEGPVVDTVDHQACVVGRYDAVACGACVGEIAALAALPAEPPPSLVELVREWQEAEQQALGPLNSGTAKAKVRRLRAAMDALLAYPLAAEPAEPSVPASAVTGITVAGARAWWALKDLEKRHEALRVAVMVAVSYGPDGDVAKVHAGLAAAFNADQQAAAERPEKP